MKSELQDYISRHRKSFLVLIAILLVGASYVYRAATHTALADNLYAGALEVAVTVLLIETILEFDHRYRLKQINAHTADNLRLMAATYALQTFSIFGCKVDNSLEMVQVKNRELVKLQESCFNSKEYKNYIEDLAKVSPSTKRSLNKISKHLIDWSKAVDKSLKEVKPYPSPELVTVTGEMVVKSVALSTLIDELYTKLPAGVTGKYTKSTKSYKEAKKITDWLWGGFVLGSNNRQESLASLIKEILDCNLKLHKASEYNVLFMDV